MAALRMLGLFLAFWLSGCAGPSAELQAQLDQADVPVFATGTLAPEGSWEAVLAPRYTKVAYTRHLAAMRLKNRGIPVRVAEKTLETTDSVRLVLDGLRFGGETPTSESQLRWIDTQLDAVAKEIQR